MIGGSFYFASCSFAVQTTSTVDLHVSGSRTLDLAFFIIPWENLAEEHQQSIFALCTVWSPAMAVACPGLRVVRGPDWRWGLQDGGEGGVGTVVEVGGKADSNSPEDTAVIQWDLASKTNYRCGYEDSHDIRVLDTASAGMSSLLLRYCGRARTRKRNLPKHASNIFVWHCDRNLDIVPPGGCPLSSVTCALPLRVGRKLHAIIVMIIITRSSEEGFLSKGFFRNCVYLVVDIFNIS